MVYALVLGTSDESHASSSLALGTKNQWSVAGCQLSVKTSPPAIGFCAALRFIIGCKI